MESKNSNAIISGEEPIIKQFESQEQEINYIGEEINKITSAGIMHSEIAIIARTNGTIKKTVSILEKNGLTLNPLEDVDNTNNKNIYYGTMHSIKGFEFKVVFIVGANSSNIPLKSNLNRLEHEREKNEFIKMEKSLLYVAITRARDKLYILGSPDISGWIIG